MCAEGPNFTSIKFEDTGTKSYNASIFSKNNDEEHSVHMKGGGRGSQVIGGYRTDQLIESVADSGESGNTR